MRNLNKFFMRFLISFYDEIFPREKRFRDMEILLYYCPHLKAARMEKETRARDSAEYSHVNIILCSNETKTSPEWTSKRI